MKKGLSCAVSLFLVLLVAAANAGGIFPEMDELFGTSMPSVGLAIGKQPDLEDRTEEGVWEYYYDFGNEEYLKFGQYLAGIGAVIDDSQVGDKSLTVHISIRESGFVFSYNWSDRIGSALYPSGTRAETKRASAEPAESILPVAGSILPSAEFVLNREPDSRETDDNGTTLTWADVEDYEYNTFSMYLGEAGAELKDSKQEAGVLNAEIALGEFSFRVVFNWKDQVLNTFYPAGTVPETTRRSAGSGSRFLEIKDSLISWDMLRLSEALGYEPVSVMQMDIGDWEETYKNLNGIGCDDITEYYINCLGDGLSIETFNIGDSTNITLYIKTDSSTEEISITLNQDQQEIVAIYPRDAFTDQKAKSVLPAIETFGRELPRLSVALERNPSKTELSQDESLTETYFDFSPEDYNTFSQYLLQTGCTLDEYHTEDDGTIVIQLSSSGQTFIFRYNPAESTGKTEYPGHSRVEKAWAPAPTPKPDTTVTVTSYANIYTEKQCWDIAYEYFLNLRWNKPESLKIYNHYSQYENNEYIFAIDYSAENSYGGTVRKYYWIAVDENTGLIVRAFGQN